MHKDCIIKNNTVSLINEEVDIRNSQYEIETLAEKEHPTQNTVELSGETYFLCCSQHNNIGHFFHDQFFPFSSRQNGSQRAVRMEDMITSSIPAQSMPSLTTPRGA